MVTITSKLGKLPKLPKLPLVSRLNPFRLRPRRKSLEMIENSLDEYSTASEGPATVTMTQDGNVRRVSRSAKLLLGRHAQDFADDNVEEMTAPKDRVDVLRSGKGRILGSRKRPYLVSTVQLRAMKMEIVEGMWRGKPAYRASLEDL